MNTSTNNRGSHHGQRVSRRRGHEPVKVFGFLSLLSVVVTLLASCRNSHWQAKGWMATSKSTAVRYQPNNHPQEQEQKKASSSFMKVKRIWTLSRATTGIRTLRTVRPSSSSSLSLAANAESQKKEEERMLGPQRHYFATCIPGLEDVLAMELEIVAGVTDVKPSGNSGVSFCGKDESVGMRALLWLRTCHRLMERIVSTESDDDDDEEEKDEEKDKDKEEEDNNNNNKQDPPERKRNEKDAELIENSWDIAQADWMPRRTKKATTRKKRAAARRSLSRNKKQQVITNEKDLYDFVCHALPMKDILGNGQGGLLTFAVRVVLNGRVPKSLCHSHYTSLTVRNAIWDCVAGLHPEGAVPPVDLENPEVPLVVVLRGWNHEYVDATIYRALHVGSLHRRGYRQIRTNPNDRNDNIDIGSDWNDDGRDDRQGSSSSSSFAVIHKAALKESLAAGLLYAAGWHKLVQSAREEEEQEKGSDKPPLVLADPMTGSATLPVEAALMAADVAPGLVRIQTNMPNAKNPPVLCWKSQNLDKKKVWKELLTDAARRAKRGYRWMQTSTADKDGNHSCEIWANEWNPRAHALAQSSITNAGFAQVIALTCGNCRDWQLPLPTASKTKNLMVVTNPPWGQRLQAAHQDESWLALGEFFSRACGGSENVWVLTGNMELTRLLRMKKTSSRTLQTADFRLQWIQYHVYASLEAAQQKKDDDDDDKEEGEALELQGVATATDQEPEKLPL